MKSYPNPRRALLVLGAAGVAMPSLALAARSDASPLVVGQSLALSGPAAPVFEPVVMGQKLALQQINGAGGIHGMPLKIVTLDDGYDPARTKDNVLRLIDDTKVTALFGLGSTAGIAAVLPLLQEKKVPLIGAYSGSPALRARQHPYFFTVTASYRDEVAQMMRNQATLQRSRVALLYINNPAGQLMVPVIEEVAREHKISISAKASLEMSGEDAVAAAQALAKGNPQAVIMMAFGPAILPFIKAARAHIGVPIYCPSIATSRQLNEALGDEARGLAYTEVLPYPFGGTMPLIQDYRAAMGAAGLPVDYDHLASYLSTRALAAILTRAGRQANSQTLPAAIEKMSALNVGGYPLAFSPTNHHGSRFVETVVVGPGGRFLR